MSELDRKLTPVKIEGVSSEEEHHKIAAVLKAMSNRWDGIEKETGIRPPGAYDYSFGLVMGEELIFATLPENKADLGQKILTAKAKKVK